MTDFWKQRHNGTDGYDCPDCHRLLKPKVSQSAKNPGRSFVSCSKDYGGCGLFSFLDEEPRFSAAAGTKSTKRPRADAPVNIVGPVAMQPQAHEQRLAELATTLADVNRGLATVSANQQELKTRMDELIAAFNQ